MLYHRGPLIQRGRGLGGILKSVFSYVKPIFRNIFSFGKKAVKQPIVRDIISDVKDTAIQTGVSTVTDLLKGESVKQSLYNNSKLARDDIAQKLIDKVESLSKKRKKTSKKKRGSKRSRDIFDDDSSEESE